MARTPQLLQQYVSAGDLSLRAWHLLLRRVTFGAALILMLASVVSLHWACNLIGLNGYWEPVAWIVPLAMETGMAAVASTATTIRKDPKPGREDQPGGYYFSLWVIFSFVMLLAQASNIGHALTTVAENDQLPPAIPREIIYGFAAAFAALFPLGGTLFVHVSGFLRAHGTGARWIGDDAELVRIQAAPGFAPTQPARAPRPAQTRTQPAQRAPEPARADAAQPAQDKGDEQARMRALFDAAVLADPFTKPDAAALQREVGSTAHPATPRRWVQKWWEEHEAQLGTARPEPAQPAPLRAVTDKEREEARA
jgi:hypothetical protein